MSSLTAAVVQSGDVDEASSFFLGACGNNAEAVQFLEKVINKIDPDVGNKRHSSNEGENSRKIIRADVVPTPKNTSTNDITADVYVNDSMDDDPLTLAVVVFNEVGLNSHMIGKQGSYITEIRNKTAAKTQLENVPQHVPTRNLFFMGKLKNLVYAYQLMQQRMDERVDGSPTDITKMIIPNELVARVIGKGGIIIKKIQSESGARTQFQTEEEMQSMMRSFGPNCGRILSVSGDLKQRCHAIYLLLRTLSEDKELSVVWRGGLPGGGGARGPLVGQGRSSMSPPGGMNHYMPQSMQPPLQTPPYQQMTAQQYPYQPAAQSGTQVAPALSMGTPQYQSGSAQYPVSQAQTTSSQYPPQTQTQTQFPPQTQTSQYTAQQTTAQYPQTQSQYPQQAQYAMQQPQSQPVQQSSNPAQTQAYNPYQQYAQTADPSMAPWNTPQGQGAAGQTAQTGGAVAGRSGFSPTVQPPRTRGQQ
mmetsp:Transcript_20755/g.20850  ORF Transcript_20755/g.20850 Transcript_20755/m.20850 type:complete len:473 (-) Transcript_20755:801-2219(-)|eukprot:CAMPEP_0182416294 /NCGR_PEP_ID=MMETSP1167-20130531/565_1 /TAXON_ID=2988 /ORGANISM="Mallomonas Sp, Strain CCMP3275" /LENGTH=472 /DNA_ID=CAMNT_0024588937 /DNA_START=75 /DNA_END=1493 /DNA_ORIENTATION=+